MAVSLATAVTEVRGRLDELTAKFWTDSQLKSWLNAGCRDIARSALCLEDIRAIPAIAGTRAYALPTNLLQIHRVEFQVATSNIYTLQLRDIHEMDAVWGTNQLQGQAYPSYAAAWGFVPHAQLYVYPSPSQNGTINVWFYRVPTTATLDADILEVPEGWDDSLYLFCEYYALRKDADARWQEAKALYDETLAELKNIPHHHDQQQYITTGPNNWASGWD